MCAGAGWHDAVCRVGLQFDSLHQIHSSPYAYADQSDCICHRLPSHPGGSFAILESAPEVSSTVEDSHAAPSNACLGSFPLKIHGQDEDEKEVSLVCGFELKGTPDEFDFFRRSRRFARHSGVMPTTDIGHKFGMHYQVPPKPPKKKGQPHVEVVLPEVETDASYQKGEANPDWSPQDAEPAAK